MVYYRFCFIGNVYINEMESSDHKQLENALFQPAIIPRGLKMPLFLHNTLTGKKEEFKPMTDNRVFFFVCGPTVYDYSHIGHGRTYSFFDTLARYLRYRGYSVYYLMNITDIDDKIINRAQESKKEGESVKDAARRLTLEMEKAFREDMAALGIDAVDMYPRATDMVPEIIEQTRTLIEKGFAYPVDGDVYFNTHKFGDFNKLTKQDVSERQVGARVEADPRKRNPEDFVLWKSSKENEPSWPSPWGEGRPGWHIEDTAITTKFFGDQYDLHGGAIDLIFPHHESEIAIAESATGKTPFVRYWVHSGFLNINKEKMSKSLGNILRIRDVLEKYPARVLRFYYLNNHYRSTIEFDWEKLDEAKAALERLDNARRSVSQSKGTVSSEPGPKEGDVLEAARKLREEFLVQMDDDLNTREAIARLFALVELTNTGLSNVKSDRGVRELLGIYNELGGDVLGIFEEGQDGGSGGSAGALEALVEILIKARTDARTNKDYARADEIRDTLKNSGIVVEDTADGARWHLA